MLTGGGHLYHGWGLINLEQTPPHSVLFTPTLTCELKVQLQVSLVSLVVSVILQRSSTFWLIVLMFSIIVGSSSSMSVKMKFTFVINNVCLVEGGLIRDWVCT